MIRSVILYWSLFFAILIPLYVISTIKSFSEGKGIICDSLLLSVFIYLSWNISSWIWRKAPSFFKEKINPSKKAVFITGCDSGFGHALAERLADYGFTIYAGCLFPSGKGAIELRKHSPKKIHIIKLDVTSQEDVDRARESVDKLIGSNHLHALVNNAGILASTEVEMGSMDPFIKQIDVNTVGLIRVTKAFLPLLRRRVGGIEVEGNEGNPIDGEEREKDEKELENHLVECRPGRVINVASLAGRFAIPGMVGYCLSKSAVISFSDGLRREMVKWGIDVITIEPHLFNTNLVHNETNHRIIHHAWTETPKEIKDAYGEIYFQGYQSFLNKVLGSARPRVSAVVDTMFTAVTEQFVAPAYKVLGDFESLRVWMWTFWPTRALDYLSYLATIAQTGQPIARMKSVYEKKKAT